MHCRPSTKGAPCFDVSYAEPVFNVTCVCPVRSNEGANGPGGTQCGLEVWRRDDDACCSVHFVSSASPAAPARARRPSPPHATPAHMAQVKGLRPPAGDGPERLVSITAGADIEEIRALICAAFQLPATPQTAPVARRRRL